MKLIALGDTHGRDAWKKVIAKEKFDILIFLGDYFDTKENISAKKQIENFKEIIAYKKANLSKVVLLLGNHDYHYLKTTTEAYSGFQFEQEKKIQKLLQPAVEETLIQICFVHEHIVFSHAGITKTWCKKNGISLTNFEKEINDYLTIEPYIFGFTPGKNNDPSGDDIDQSPIWVRPQSLLEDRIPNYLQVVGHTMAGDIYLNKVAIFIDTLATSGEYLIYEDGKFDVGQIF